MKLGIAWIAAALCAAYGIIICAASKGSFASAWWIWFVGAGLFLAHPLCHRLQTIHPGRFIMPEWFKVSLHTTMVLGMTVVGGLCLLIALNMHPKQSDLRARYLIVLGGKVNGSEPSQMLKDRLDTALEYWRENPEVTIIVSGGKGKNERYSEADVMAYYLVNNGIPDSRIVRETQSGNTQENITNSARYLYSKNVPVRIVTSDYHVYRAVKLAQSQKLVNASGLASQSRLLYLPHYVVRESLAVIKDFLSGNI